MIFSSYILCFSLLPNGYKTLIYDTIKPLNNQMLYVANNECTSQAAMNGIKVILSCLKYYRLDLMFILSYILRYSIGYGNFI